MENKKFSNLYRPHANDNFLYLDQKEKQSESSKGVEIRWTYHNKLAVTGIADVALWSQTFRTLLSYLEEIDRSPRTYYQIFKNNLGINAKRRKHMTGNRSSISSKWPIFQMLLSEQYLKSFTWGGQYT